MALLDTISLTRFVLFRGFSTSSQLLRISKPAVQVTKMVGSIGTHDGKFHCDEAFACFILKRLNQFRDYKLIREFNETMQTLGVLDFNTRLSSAGLIYAHYGKQLIAELLGCSHEDEMVAIFYRRLYETFVEAIDAVDNGIPQYDGTPRYDVLNRLFISSHH
ncbi:unnamed protein product [Strongylus vulgaris]|uniref:Uncharacterized protein n=1 Tax=Strongylus vulgaris TaxID=40348 RepID=A0A3P7JET3_STRVU|nr:unnamed protein product [Strongylus vulgaris]